jgi:Tfp pilus assembly protein PilV
MNPARTLARRARRARAGTTFVELMLAVVIVSTTLLASTASMQGSAQVYHYFADGKHEALMLAQEIHEAAKLMPWTHAVGADPVFGDNVYDVWDLDGKTFNPPRSADYDIVVSHIGWSQSCEVRVVDMAHTDVEVDPATFQGPTLTELKVVIKQGSEVVDSPCWWLSTPTGA